MSNTPTPEPGARCPGCNSNSYRFSHMKANGALHVVCVGCGTEYDKHAPEPGAPTPEVGAWVCNKCGGFGEADSRNKAEQQHRLKFPNCDYLPAWSGLRAPVAALPPEIVTALDTVILRAQATGRIGRFAQEVEHDRAALKDARAALTAAITRALAAATERAERDAEKPRVNPPPAKRTCNRHDDCDAADAEATAKGRRVDHCHDEECEECFGY